MPLHITRLRFKDFKSFRKANIPIHEGFTAIAGANASGKSNIFDGLLFVMGITSLKMLRASRLTDLVHHNSSEGYAKVEMDLADGETEWTFTRMIDKQGKSVYKINGKRRTLNEVSELLGSLKINPFGHNFVVQGDITKIIEMNERQRRELIDNAAGLSEFEEKKQEAMKKLEAVDKRIKDTMIVLKERESYLAELEKEKLAAEKFNSLKAELASAKATILSEEILRIKAELASAERTRTELSGKIKRLENEKNQLNESEKETEKKISDLTEQLISASRETFSGIGKKAEELRAQEKFLKEKISLGEAKANELNSKTELLKEKKKHLNSAKKDLGEKEAKLNESLKELRASLEKISSAINSKSSGTDGALKKINSFEEKLKDLRKGLEAKKDELNSVQSTLKLKENEVNSFNSRLNEARQEMDSLLQKIDEKKKISSELEAVKKQGTEKKLEDLREKIDLKTAEMAEKTAEKNSLLEELSRLKKSASLCPVCDSRLDEAKKKSIAQKKESKAKMLETGIAGLSQEKKALKEKELLLEKQLQNENELKFRLNSFVHFDKMLEELKEKISRINSVKEKESRVIDDLRKRNSVLAPEVREQMFKESALENDLNELRKSSGAVELNELMKKQNDLSAETGAKEIELAKIQTELSKGVLREILAAEEEEKEIIAQKGKNEKEISSINSRSKENEKELKEKEAELEAKSKANKLIEEEKQRLTVKLGNIEAKKSETEKKSDLVEKELNEFNLTQSRNEVRIVDLEQEFESFKDMPIVKFDSISNLKARVPQIEKEINALGAINMRALEGFENYKKEVDDVRGKAEKLDMERKSILDLIDKIDVKKLNIFMECFSKVNSRFRELYYSFFEGEGKLELTDAINPLEGGLSIQAKYAEDKMKHLDAMSGGEKSLTALAFLFALQSVEPAPIYVFDEADAALDRANSVKVGRLVKEISRESQFISITHNDEIVKLADQIIGVAMSRQKSSLIGLRLKGKIEQNGNGSNGEEKKENESEEEAEEKNEFMESRGEMKEKSEFDENSGEKNFKEKWEEFEENSAEEKRKN